VLRIHTKNMKLDENVDLELIAKDTHGYASSSSSSMHAVAAPAASTDASIHGMWLVDDSSVIVASVWQQTQLHA
jgi:ATP-dependent 26S proteasome regulatory subunit